LIVYGSTTEEKLQGVADNKEEFARRLTPKGVPDAICDLLFAEYVSKKRSGSGGGEPPASRQRILDRSNPVGVGKLWSRLHKTKTLDGNVLQFDEKVLDSRSDLLWERPSYTEMYDAVWAAAVRVKDRVLCYFPVVVTGTSGIGKSFFGIYAAFRAVREKDITVVYTMYGVDQSIKRYVIAPSPSKMASFTAGDPRRLLLGLRKDFPGMIGEDKVDDKEDDTTKDSESLWWGELDDMAPESAKFRGRLLDGESTWVFADVQKGNVLESSHRVIVLVSDDPSTYSSFIKHTDGVVLYMSVWSCAELKSAQDRIAPSDTKQLDDRYSMVGGVPRSVFSANWDQTLGEVRRAIADLTPGTLATTLVPGSNPRVTSRLVHQVSTSPFCNKDESTTTVTSVYASEYVRTAIYNRFLLEEQFKLHTWLRYTKGLVGGKERGPQFEWFAHVVLGKLDKQLPVKVTELLMKGGVPVAKAPKHGATEDKSLARFASSTVLFKTLDDIKSLKVGQYMQPLDENFPAIDAFCVSAGVPWETQADHAPVLLLFQMTVARSKHPTLGQAIKDVIDLAHKLGPFNKNKHDIYLVFVTDGPLAGAEPYLTVTKGGKLTEGKLGDLKKIKQVCMQIE
jgi:hypothetical protein